MKKVILILLICFFSLFFSSADAANEETLIIFDASISMIDNFSGQPKYVLAVEEAKKALDKMPDVDKIGLRTIGITLDSSILYLLQNPDELCKATQLAVPISRQSKQSIKSNLDTIFPLGTTPLTYTLEHAINYDFSNSAPIKHIILITDGAESCDGDPCKYISLIMNSRNDIVIDIIAIGVNSEDFKQLKCLSDNTNGTIFNISRPSELQQAFSSIFTPDFNKDNSKSIYDNPTLNDDIIYKNYMFETYY